MITDSNLIRALITVDQSEDRMRTVIGSMGRDVPHLDREFPDAIRRVRASESIDATQGSYTMGAECPFLDTQPDPQFLSTLVHLTSMNEGYVHFLQEHAQKLEELEIVLRGGALREAAASPDGGEGA